VAGKAMAKIAGVEGGEAAQTITPSN